MEEVRKKETKEVRRKETKEVRRKETKAVPKKETKDVRRKETKEVLKKATKEVRRQETKEVPKKEKVNMKELHKKEMEELHKIAWAYYEVGAPENIKEEVRDFFRKMTCTKKEDKLDHKVKVRKFLAFAQKELPSKMNNSEFFNDLIFTEGNDSIGFWEIVTLYYILVSGRPFCDGCGNFIKGIFFTCDKCFHSKSASFNICISCFEKKKYNHEHEDQFLDNVLLLEMSRKPECQTSQRAMKSQPPAATSKELVLRNSNASPVDTAIIFWKIVSSGASAGAAIVSIASTFGCSIM